jgi:hypothetical protein
MTIIGKVKNMNQMEAKNDFLISARVTNGPKPNPAKPAKRAKVR